MSAPDWEGFGRDLMESWPVRDVDGAELFEAALRNGLLHEIPSGYDPDQHTDTEGICPEPGDPWYEYSFGIARTDTTHTDADADLERAVRAALDAAAKDAASKALFGYMDRSDRYAGGIQVGVYRMSKAIRDLDPAEIVRAARKGGE